MNVSSPRESIELDRARPSECGRAVDRHEQLDAGDRSHPICGERHRRQDYTPSPEEIRAACREIQKEWSEKERRRRAGITRDFWLGKQCRPSRVSFAS